MKFSSRTIAAMLLLATTKTTKAQSVDPNDICCPTGGRYLYATASDDCTKFVQCAPDRSVPNRLSDCPQGLVFNMEIMVCDFKWRTKCVPPTEYLCPKKEPENPSSGGDPHFKTWSGKKYDFHGACDMVLLKNPNFAHGLGLDIHIRTHAHSWWSSIDTAVVRVGEYTLEVTGGDKDKVQYWLNGVHVEEMETGDASLGDFAVRFHRINGHQSQTRLDLGNGNALSIETFKKFVRVNIKHGKGDEFKGSVGLLGAYPSGKMLGRDNLTVFEDTDAFGQEWQVLPSEPSLFHTMEGSVQPPMKCQMPNRSQARRRLGESLITQEEAVLACARVEEENRNACIFDVLATNDKEMAGSY